MIHRHRACPETGFLRGRVMPDELTPLGVVGETIWSLRRDVCVACGRVWSEIVAYPVPPRVRATDAQDEADEWFGRRDHGYRDSRVAGVDNDLT